MESFSMKKSICRFLPVILLLFFATISCERIEVPTNDSSSSKESQDNTIPPAPDKEKDSEIQEDKDTQPDLNDPAGITEYVISRGYSEIFPYTIFDIKTYIPAYLNFYGADGIKDCYVRGYIVGFVNGSSISKAIFGAGNTKTNIVLAGSPDETTINHCIAVQLTTTSSLSIATRQALNLADNPQNIGKPVTIYGNIGKYMGTLGIKNARNFWWEEYQ